jgi:N-acetyl-anhydromuramyl-L-alanine amidase AmpD
MSHRTAPLLMALAGASLFSGGLVFWLARGLMSSSPSSSGQNPSLMEILDDVRRGHPASPGSPKPAPQPPSQTPWRSPLTDACLTPDPGLSQRLRDQYAKLNQRVQRIGIHPSNFSERQKQDAFGNRVDPKPRVVVLHETVYGLNSAINTFVTPHPQDDDQVSYHMLVGEDGRIIQALDPGKRAFGAGYSAFHGEWVITNQKVGGSINNFALHLSLETPLDGENDDLGHSGYSQAQYDAMALVLANWMRRYQIPAENITTHRYVDLGGERADPRSFNWNELKKRLIALGVLC